MKRIMNKFNRAMEWACKRLFTKSRVSFDAWMYWTDPLVLLQEATELDERQWLTRSNTYVWEWDPKHKWLPENEDAQTREWDLLIEEIVEEFGSWEEFCLQAESGE